MHRVLVVDDDNFVRALVSKVMRDAGYEVEESSDGSEAIAKLKEELFDLVITDVVMPNQSGVSVATYIKDNKLITSILAMSAYSSCDASVLGLVNYYADDTLQKPIDKDVLLKAAARLLGNKDVGEALQNM